MTWLPWIVAGLLLGVFSAWSPGGLCILALVAFIALLLHRVAAREHRRFLVTLFLVGFAIRALVSLGLDVGARVAEGHWPSKHSAPHDWDLGIVFHTREYVRIGDSDYLLQRGYATAQLARGNREPVVVYRAQQGYGWNGYAYVLGAFCYLFDFSPHAVNFLNCLLGALLGPLLFFLAVAYRFEDAVTRWAAVVVAGFPSLILWSATNLKEPALHLLTASLLLLFARIPERRSLHAWVAWGLLTAGALAAHATLRSASYTGLLAGCCLAAWGVRWCTGRWRVVVAAGGLLTVALAMHGAEMHRLLATLFQLHLGHVWTQGISYRYLPETFYMTSKGQHWLVSGCMSWEVLGWIATAAWSYLVEPLPRRLDNLFVLCTYPQMIVWYFLLPLAALGAYAAIRSNLRRTLGWLATLAAWIVLGGLTNGNIGTLFRVRDMITPFVVLLACAGAFWCVYGRSPFRIDKDGA